MIHQMKFPLGCRFAIVQIGENVMQHLAAVWEIEVWYGKVELIGLLGHEYPRRYKTKIVQA